MDMKRKVEIANTAILSITRHDDADTRVRAAALDMLDDLIARERQAMTERADEKVTALFGDAEKKKD